MKVAIYSRKSKFTGKGESIENQIELCKQYVKLHYSETAESDILAYEDEGFSGGNIDRPQFKKMMKAANEKGFSAIICYRLDRISRNIGDFAKLIEELNDLSISFVSIKEQFDTASPLGRAMMYIASVFSQLERETIAERIRDNMHELAKTGRWLGGMTPTGYKSETIEKITIDGKVRKAYKLTFLPDEIETVKLIYDKFIETNSLTKVETYLIQHNIMTRSGKHFTRFSIKNILENPVYMTADLDSYSYFSQSDVELCFPKEEFDGSHGIMAYNKTLQKPGHSTRTRDMEDWIVAIGKHRGILSGRDWIAVQEMLNQNKSKSYRKPKSNTALLSGLLRCGGCGSYIRPKLTQRQNAKGELIYTYLCELKEKSHGHNCSIRNINGNILDKAVCAEITKLSEDNSVFLQQLKNYERSLTHNRGEYDTELENLNRIYHDNGQEITNLVSMLAKSDGTSAYDYITAQINELHKKNISLKNQIIDLKHFTKTCFLTDEQIEIIKDLLRSFASAFDTMTVEQKRTDLRILVSRIVWDGENVHIFLLGANSENILIPQCDDSK